MKPLPVSGTSPSRKGVLRTDPSRAPTRALRIPGADASPCAALPLWALRRNASHCDLGNLAAGELAQITRAVKRRLEQIQYRPDLVDGCLAVTGLMMGG
ncbi:MULTISPECIES: hypothetical protein [unclassified Streptomyces]|uniref:hypothetical protein n=1 Tax=unclassified Streptomyces TaxID=2593676 RepID=UPI0033E8AEEA